MEEIKELLIEQTPGVISYNFEGTKKMLAEKLEEFNGAVFTEDSKTFAKKTVASLRSEKKEVEKRIREVKKSWLAPYEAFEKDAKELVAMYDEPINFINDQVQGFEDKRKAEKQDAIKQSYEDLVTMKEYLPLERIYNKRWENATYKLKDVEEDLRTIDAKTSEDVDTIKAFESEDEADALKAYKNTLNALDAIQLINERARVRADALQREREAAEAKARREAEERVRAEERAKIEAEQQEARRQEEAAQKEQEAAEQARQEVIESLTPAEEPEAEMMFYDYTIMLTPEGKEKLEMYMDSVGIDYILK